MVDPGALSVYNELLGEQVTVDLVPKLARNRGECTEWGGGDMVAGQNVGDLTPS